jgi:myo-inositol-1(or 4)-monophosphatase
MEKDWQAMEEVGRRAVLAAGEEICKHLGAPAWVEAKAAADFVTDVDRRCEGLIVDAIREAFPDHHIFSEETPFEGWKPGITWIIDPLDGTTNFIHGFPLVSVSVAVAMDREVILGFVLEPILGEFFSARKGAGAFLNGKRISVRPNVTTRNALIATGFPHRSKAVLEPYLAALGRVLRAANDMRRGGSAALDLAYVAAGRLDGFWEPGLKTWDVAAGALLVREAGGVVSDFWGEADYFENGHVVAGVQVVHRFLMEQVGYELGPALKNG